MRAPFFFVATLIGCGSAPVPPAAEPASSETSSPAPASTVATRDDVSSVATADTAAPAEESASLDEASRCHQAAAAWEQKARPQLKACYREGKKTDPNLMGSASFVTEVDYTGKPKPARIDGISSLGKSVTECMRQALSDTPFDGAEACKTRALTVPVEFPTPHR